MPKKLRRRETRKRVFSLCQEIELAVQHSSLRHCDNFYKHHNKFKRLIHNKDSLIDILQLLFLVRHVLVIAAIPDEL